MKVSLRYQITEFDCGPTSFFNAINYLYNRSEIPADLTKIITSLTLDEYNPVSNDGGTSKEAMRKLTKILMKYTLENDFDLVCEQYEKEEVTIDRIKEWIAERGVVIARLMQSCEHYALITALDDDYVYLFDPYYFREDHYDSDSEVDIIFDRPFEYNRRVNIMRFLGETKKDFALGKIENREFIGIKRKETK